jgi:hypothetical protein
MGREMKVPKSPCDSCRARRKFSSTMGPRTKPSRMGVIGRRSFRKMAPTMPKNKTSMT